MGKYRRILVAVDGSESSKSAFRQACRIAHEDESLLTAIMSIPLFQDQFDVLSTREKIGQSLKEHGERVFSEIRKIAGNEHIAVKELLVEGPPSMAIADATKDGKYDLIVMGRRGMTRLERALMGSVTAGVIGHTEIDALVVPKDSVLGWKNILLCTDGSEISEAATRHAIDYAQSYGGSLTAVSVVDVNEEFYAQAPQAVEDMVGKARKILDSVKEKAALAHVKAETVIREGETHGKIVELAAEKNADILFMGSHGRAAIMRLLMGSVTAKVIGYSPCPVMVIKK